MNIESEILKLENLVNTINSLIKKNYIVFDEDRDILEKNEKFYFLNGELLLSKEGKGGRMYLLPKGDTTIYGCRSYLHEIQNAIKRLKKFKYISHIKSI